MYIPIMKNRMYENKLLRENPGLFYDDKIIPLIEIIYLKIRNKEVGVQEMLEYYENQFNSKFFVDFFTFEEDDYNAVDFEKVFFPLTIRNEDKYKYLDDLLYETVKCNKAIPVVSIKSAREFILFEGYIRKIIRTLQEKKPSIAIRIQPKYLEKYFMIIEEMLRDNDYLMYDINESSIDPLFFDIEMIRYKTGNYKTIILNSPVKSSNYNFHYKDGDYTILIDNSIRVNYNSDYGFDGFGDYAGLKNELPHNGSYEKGSALALFFDDKVNKFFSIVNMDDTKGPSGYDSVLYQVLNKYKEILDHDGVCPALKYINDNLDAKNKTGTWGTWKYITVLRYISQIKKSTKY